MNYAEESLKKHYEWGGKIEMASRVAVETIDDLSLAYTPGVAQPCLAIAEDVGLSFRLTRRFNTVAVITDGTAVLGLGDIGPEAAMPVMEGKAVLFKELGGVDAVPLCIRSKDTDEIVKTICLLAGNFGAINLEDISAPRCFEIERRLKQCCDIPVFHDDQHGTAIVVLAAVINALRCLGREINRQRIVINGAGAAGIAVTRILQDAGAGDIILCDSRGIIYQGRGGLNDEKEQMAGTTNKEQRRGTLADALTGSDIFIGLSVPGCVTKEMVRSMNKNPVVFPLSNPVPEIMPGLAEEAGAAVVGTGRSDFKNQVNNALAFPGVIRGALDARARDISDAMKKAAAEAIAGYIDTGRLSAGSILPNPLDRGVAKAVAAAVAAAAAARPQP